MISTRDRRAIVIGAATIGVAWLTTRALPLYERFADRFAELQLRRGLVQRATEDISNRPRYILATRALRASIDSASKSILADTSAADAEQSLLDAIDGVLAEHEVRVLVLEPSLDDHRAGLMSRVSVRIVLESDLDGTVVALHDIESDAASQLVALRITSPEGTDSEPQTEVLHVEATVAAWFRTTSAAPR